MSGLAVDVDAIHLLTHHLRTAAAELAPEHALLLVPDDAFESPVASALTATNTDLRRQAGALAEFVTALADAGDRAAHELVRTDAALATGSHGGR